MKGEIYENPYILALTRRTMLATKRSCLNWSPKQISLFNHFWQ
jgi:hypothetical protein